MVGTSGAGKTTLVMALLGLLAWRGGTASGEVLINGCNGECNLLTMSARQARRVLGKTIALVPQSPWQRLQRGYIAAGHFEEAWRAHESSGQKALDARLVAADE